MFQAKGVLEKFFANGKARLFQKGEVIIAGEVNCPYIYYISSGFVKGYTISDEGCYRLLTIKSQSDVIPLAHLFDEYSNALYYEAMTDVMVRRVARAEFEAALADNHELSLATLKKSVVVLRDYIERIENLSMTDARQRIIARLLYLLDRFGANSKDNREVIFVPITYPDLADSLNLSRETANRIVSRLVSEGLVAKTRGYVTVIDKARLVAGLDGSLLTSQV